MFSAKMAAVYLSAFVLRLAFAPFFGHSWDVYVWIKSGELFYRGTNVYMVNSLTDFPWGFYTYPPIWLYWVGAVYYLSTFFTNINIHVFLLKIPIIVSDIIIAVLISRICTELGLVRVAGKASIIWLYNPLVIAISSVWGMFAVVLSLAGLLMIMRGRNLWAGSMFGLGAAIKIYPLLLVVPAALFLRFVKKSKTIEAVKMFAVAVAAFILPLIPFLQNPVPIIDKLLYHFGNIGSFTYWTVLSVISPPPIIPLLSYGFFICLLCIALRKHLRGNAGIVELSEISLLAFLSTSAKVNVQYVLWVLPFLIIRMLKNSSKAYRINTVLLMAAGLLFIVSAQIALAIFDLQNIGRIVISKELGATLAGVLLIASALLGGTRFIALFLELLKEKGKPVLTLQRMTFISLIMVFILVVSIFPAGQGVVIPKARIRVGVTEGIESLFNKSDEYRAEMLVMEYDLTHIVFPLGPDGILYGGDLSKAFRFKLSTDRWSEQDVRILAKSIRQIGVKPLLGLYLKAYYISTHFGHHGYNSSFLIENFRKCVDLHGNIYFQCITENGIGLAEFFAERAVAAAVSMGFEGIYLMGISWSNSNMTFESILTLLQHLREKSIKHGLEIFLEYDPMSLENPIAYLLSNNGLFDYTDYVVLVTNPFLRTVKEPLRGNYTINDFRNILEKAVAMFPDKKFLFTINVMDIAEGWMTPALQLQTEINEFSNVKGVAGYAIYHVSRYLPIKISFRGLDSPPSLRKDVGE